MARTGANYSIKVGVDLDTSDIQKQLREAAKNNQLKLEATGAGSVRELTDAVDKNQESIEAAQFSYQVANQIFRTTIEIISSMIDQVYELDGALTEFKKVSDLTGNSLTNYVGKLSDLGKTTARTTSEMVEAATTFRKNSFSDEDSARLAQVATMYQNVADTSISAADAASFIISQMKAFGIEAANASDVIDKVNKVANNMAVGTNDLSSALEVAGAGLSTYNNSFEETIGLVTAGSEIMTGRSLQVARGLNTIAARIVKNQDLLAEYGIALNNTDGSMRSTFEILSDLSDAWAKMSDEERVSVGDTLAGTNQFKVLAAVMTNFQSAVKANELALDAQGSATEENNRILESLEAKTTALKAAFQDLGNNVIPKELIARGLDALVSILEALDTDVGRVVVRFGLLTSLLTGFAGISKFFIMPIIDGIKGVATAATAASGAVGALGTALGMFLPYAAIIAGIAVAVYSIAKAVEESNVTYEEHLDNLNRINSEYESNQDKIAELQSSADILNAKEQHRLDLLQAQTKELERQRREEVSGAVSSFETETNRESVFFKDTGEYASGKITKPQHIRGLIEEYQYLSNTTAETIEEQDRLDSRMTEIIGTLANYSEEIDGLIDQGGEFSSSTMELYNAMNHLIQATSSLSKAEELRQQMLAKGYTNKEIDNMRTYRRYLLEEQGTVESVQEAMRLYVDERVEEGDEMSSIMQSGVYQQYLKILQDIVNISEDATEESIDFSEALNLLYQSVQSVDEQYKDAISLQKQIDEGYAFTSEEIAKLIAKYPELTKKLQRSSEGWKIEGNAIDIVGFDMNNLASIVTQAQSIISTAISSGTAARLKAYGLELEGVKSLSQVWSAIAGTDVTAGLRGGEARAARSKALSEAGLSQGDYQVITDVIKANQAIDDALAKLSELGTGVAAGGGGGGGGGSAESKTDAKLQAMKDTVDLLKTELTILEKTNATDEERIAKIREIQNALNLEAEYMRSIGASEAEINELAASWADYQNEIYKILQNQYKLQTEALQKQADAYSALGSIVQDYADEQILALNDQLDALKAANEELETEIEYEKKLDDLARARQSKVMVYKDGRFQYVEDVDKVGAAASSLETFERERALEAEQKAIQDQIQVYEDYKAAWGNLADEYKKESDRQLVEQQLHIDLEQANWETMLANAQDYVTQYTALMRQLAQAQTLASGATAGVSSGIDWSAKWAEAQADTSLSTTERKALQEYYHAQKVIEMQGSGKTYNPTTGAWYANGTLSAKGGMSLVGERGPELRVLNSGDGILPSDITANLWRWGEMSPASFVKAANLGSFNQAQNMNVTIQSLSLPNVTNGEDFVDYVRNNLFGQVMSFVH